MEIVKSGWFYRNLEIHSVDDEHIYIYVWNEELNSNMDAYPVKKVFRLRDEEFVAIREFVRENPKRVSFQIQRTNGGAVNVGIQI